MIDNQYTERYNKTDTKLLYYRYIGGESLENKALIMECAKHLFYAKGYDAVGVQEIVDRVGITKPTLYYYFGSKIGLLKTLLSERLSGFQDSLYNESQSDARIEDVLSRFAVSYCNFFEGDREFYMLFMALFYSARENEVYHAVKPYVSDFYDKVVHIFENAADQLGNMNGRQRQFAIGFIGTINHYLMLRFEEDTQSMNSISEQEVLSVVRQFMYGIFS